MIKRVLNSFFVAPILLGVFAVEAAEKAGVVSPELEQAFTSPSASARPWVYWYFMDGNMTREGMTADLEAMQKAGIGGVIFLEVNLGIPRGPVDFMSGSWRELLKHAINEADRLGLEFALGSGPGWCGTGGPWVKPELSMQHLVGSETTVTGPVKYEAVLPRPQPRVPFFGMESMNPEMRTTWEAFYRDVAVIAFPTPEGAYRIPDIDEKALYYRGSYSSQIVVPNVAHPGVLPFVPASADQPSVSSAQCIPGAQVIDLTGRLTPDGKLSWDVPQGRWTILRFGRTVTGQNTRPAPEPGLGFESDKFDTAALDAHFEAFIGELMKTVGKPQHTDRGLTMLHFDSWEMGSQNWSEKFREEFQKRRGYDSLRYLPTLLGKVVESAEVSERFLWDLRQTAQELVVENHGLRLKELGQRYGLKLSLEPYDLNPSADLRLGSVADVPQCEFWSEGYGWPIGSYSPFEAASIGHTQGRPVVAAEAFTSSNDAWRQHPNSMKNQGDWALCSGVNKIIFHRYQHQPQIDQFPGMTFGYWHGIHWERTQTWWDLVPAYHLYLSRCQELLRRGLFVADILYLAPEGAPHVFRPPASALRASGMPDRLGYNFDGCDPETLIERAAVHKGRIVFPDGMSYRLLVMPRFDTMTPRLLRKISELVASGATVVGGPPRKSPSLANYPRCDDQVKKMANKLWGMGAPVDERSIGKGRLIYDACTQVQSIASNPIMRAQWIWHSEGSPAQSAPVCTRYFRREITIDHASPVESAVFLLTADNSYELFVNAQPVGSGDNFHNVQAVDVGARLKPGVNVLTVIAVNGSDQPNPAGLIGALTIRFRDGTSQIVTTDRLWSSSVNPGGGWTPAMELGAFNMGPWSLSPDGKPQTEIYPDYAMTAHVLSKMGVPPDVDADGSIRYIHRRDGQAEIYFIASRLNRPQALTCRFRVTGRQPEWWNPISGECRDLPEFSDSGGVTSIPIRFEAFESGFVVFRKPASTPSRTGRNFPDRTPLVTLNAPWDVSFDARWGGPEKIVFISLDDWSKRTEPGIKYYSGKAVYRTTFDCAADVMKNKERCSLDLGTVKNMASVKLNGKDLGIVWCDPWRVEIQAGCLLERDNRLEITVANLWSNRLIGDSALPQDKRLTRTTWDKAYQPNAPLQESGLIGPVRIMVNE